MDFTGKIALITGANGHLGQAVARLFSTHGATVALVGRDRAALEAVEVPGPRLLVTADVTDEPQVATALDQVHQAVGGPDFLLNVVGGYAGGQAVVDLDLATWQGMLNLNLTSAFLCSKHALHYMIPAGFGRIISVSSKAAVDLPAAAAAYAVSKAGLNALTACLAREAKGTAVSVAAVMPSVIDTPPNRAAMPKADPARWVTPEQVAQALALLCTVEAVALNGAIVPVYGGV